MTQQNPSGRQPDRTDRIIDKHERRRLVPYSDVQVWRLEREGAFPKRIKLGPGRVGWSFNELQAWIAERLNQR